MPQVDEVHSFGVGGPFRLEEGTLYLARGKNTESSYRLARRVAADGTPVLCVSRLHPDRVRSRFGLTNAALWWISTSPGEDTYNPTAVGTLASAIGRFIDGHPDGCLVLLDGLEYIAINIGADKTVLFLEHLNEFVMPRRATLLVPVSPECFEPTEFARLERFTEGVDEAELRDSLDAQALDRQDADG